jgi:trigger factor
VSRVLRRSVAVGGKVYVGGTTPPTEVAEKVTNAAAWEDGGTSAASSPEPTAMAAGDDPAAFTVAEVQAYLAGADDAEKERVLAAEAAGKNRSTITGS